MGNEMTATRHTVNLSGIDLAYWEWNPGGKPLLLLHGLADCGMVWFSLGDYLAADYHVIAPDLRGHGDSSKPNTGYTFDDLIGDLERLMVHLNWDSANVLAHSWSAKLLAIWATKNSDRIKRMILVDPFFIDRLPGWMEITFPLLYRVLPFLKLMQPFLSYEAAEAQGRKLKQYQGWSKLQQQVFQHNIEEKPNGTWSSKFSLSARDRIFHEVMQVAGLTQEISIPTLFVKPLGGLNKIAWQLKPYKTYLKNLQIKEVPGNHWAFLVEPEVFNLTIKEFLQLKFV